MDQVAIESFIGREVYWLIGFALLFLVRNIVEGAISGILVFVGNDYNSDDVIYINGRPGRIIRVGLYKTVFFLYDVKNDPYTGDAQVIGGTKVVVQNDKLSSLKIEKPLQNIDLERYKQDPTKMERREDA
tara:strand:- start:428 stop:817 length:390 start_codon:yes stop_codon:yes gene_type:complete